MKPRAKYIWQRRKNDESHPHMSREETREAPRQHQLGFPVSGIF